MKCIGAVRKDGNRQRLDVIYRVVQKTGLFWGPQNFVKNIRRKANDMSKFSELCLEFNNVICMSQHYIYSLPNLRKLSCTSKSQRFDNVDAGVSLISYSKCSKQDDNKDTEE